MARLTSQAHAKGGGYDPLTVLHTGVAPDGRNNALFRAACQLFRGGLSVEDVQTRITQGAHLCNANPPSDHNVTDSEVRAIVASAQRSVSRDNTQDTRPTHAPALPADNGVSMLSALWPLEADAPEAKRARVWLMGRKIDAARIASVGSVGVLSISEPMPQWARGWVRSQHWLMVPMVDNTGAIQSWRARYVGAGKTDAPKSLAPKGARIHELVMACPRMRSVLRGDADAIEHARRHGIAILEGETDWLYAQSCRPQVACVGIVSGCWTPKVAARIPDGCTVSIEKDSDGAGERYAEAIIATLRPRIDSGALRVHCQQRSVATGG
jgi:hypothetical protein